MHPLIWLYHTVIDLYVLFIIVGAIMSWLVAFNVINRNNQFVSMIWGFTYQITEPALRPIRNILPNLGGIDISPIILIIGLMFLKRVLDYVLFPILM